MFRNLLKPGSGLMITMTQITDCIFLSLFFFLTSVPVLTLGASLAALYDAAYQGFRRGEKHCWTRYFQTFRRNLKPSLVPCLVFLAVCAGLTAGLIRLWNGAAAGAFSWMLFSAGAFIAMLAAGILGILFPMLSRFENPTGVLLKNTVLLGIASLPRTLVLGVLNTAVVMACFYYIIPLFFLPCLGALISTLLIEPIFRPYLPKEEA